MKKNSNTLTKSKKALSMSMRGTFNHKTGAGKGGRILEAELNVLFQNLTGVKNFDVLDEKALSHTNKTFNKMYDSTAKNIVLARSSCLESSHNIIYSKMDFRLFVKSFEYIAKKLYGHKSLDKAVLSLLNNVR